MKLTPNPLTVGISAISYTHRRRTGKRKTKFEGFLAMQKLTSLVYVCLFLRRNFPALCHLVQKVIEKKGLDMVRRDWSLLSKELGDFCLSQILSRGRGTATVDIPFSVKTFKFAANSLSKFAGHFIESLSMELKLSPAVEAMVLPATGCLLFRGGTATTEDVVAEQSYAYLFPLCN
nr:DNA polymerase alpha catalytic subunit [Ipomoea batatas]